MPKPNDKSKVNYCVKCESWMPIEFFSCKRNSNKSDTPARRRSCDKCFKNKKKSEMTNWYRRNRDFQILRQRYRYRLKSTYCEKFYRNKAELARANVLSGYGLTIDDYNSMLKYQNGVCKICLHPCTKRLAVDHCHKTGKVRGLLCASCNALLGCAKDNIDILHNSIAYLQDNQ